MIHTQFYLLLLTETVTNCLFLTSIGFAQLLIPQRSGFELQPVNAAVGCARNLQPAMSAPTRSHSQTKRFSESFPLQILQRPSKIALGKASFSPAFGASLPRGLMPPSVTQDKEARRSARLFASSRHHHSSLAAKIEALTEETERIHARNRQRGLNYRSRAGKRAFVAGRRLAAAAQEGLRPSDRWTDIRGYTLSDNDAWSYADLRQWYNRTSQSHRSRTLPRESSAVRIPAGVSSGQTAHTPIFPRSDRGMTTQSMLSSGYLVRAGLH